MLANRVALDESLQRSPGLLTFDALVTVQTALELHLTELLDRAPVESGAFGPAHGLAKVMSARIRPSRRVRSIALAREIHMTTSKPDAVPPPTRLHPEKRNRKLPLTPAEREFVRWLIREALKSWAP